MTLNLSEPPGESREGQGQDARSNLSGVRRTSQKKKMEQKLQSILKMKENKALTQIIRTLKQEFHPEKLFLFGSRTNGTARTDSDYDFVLVVKETDKTRAENLIRAKKLFRKTEISADVFVYSQKEFDEWKDDFSSIPEVAINTGQEIDLATF